MLQPSYLLSWVLQQHGASLFRSGVHNMHTHLSFTVSDTPRWVLLVNKIANSRRKNRKQKQDPTPKTFRPETPPPHVFLDHCRWCVDVFHLQRCESCAWETFKNVTIVFVSTALRTLTPHSVENYTIPSSIHPPANAAHDSRLASAGEEAVL